MFEIGLYASIYSTKATVTGLQVLARFSRGGIIRTLHTTISFILLFNPMLWQKRKNKKSREINDHDK